MKLFDLRKERRPRISAEAKIERRRRQVAPYIIGLILGFALFFGFITIQGKSSVKKEEPTKESQVSNEASGVENNQTEQTSITDQKPVPQEPAQAEQSSQTTQNTIDKSKITIQVLNGNGIRGDAAKVKQILQKDGWIVASSGNAASFKYQNTLVYYKQDQEDIGNAVAETLKNAARQTGMQVSTTLKKYDILVIVGKK